MQAILIRQAYDCNGNRTTSARCMGGKVRISNSYKSDDECAWLAVEALIRKLRWLPSEGRGYEGVWTVGTLPNGDRCAVFTADRIEGDVMQERMGDCGRRFS